MSCPEQFKNDTADVFDAEYLVRSTKVGEYTIAVGVFGRNMADTNWFAPDIMLSSFAKTKYAKSMEYNAPHFCVFVFEETARNSKYFFFDKLSNALLFREFVITKLTSTIQ